MDFIPSIKKSAIRLRFIMNINGLAVFLMFVAFSVVGCATTRQVSELYPPVMDLGELSQPYVKIAVIDCSSTRFGNLEAVTPQDIDWAYNELRERAQRLGADAVVLTEVRVERDTFLFFPVSQIRAKGIAIKFR